MQNSLFDKLDFACPIHELIETPMWSDKQRLMEEKMSIGFYLSGHLFDGYRNDLQGVSRKEIGKLHSSRDLVTIAGIITGIRIQLSKRGKMAIVTLDDTSGQIDIVFYNEHLDTYKDELREDNLIILSGKASEDKYSGGLRFNVEKFLDLVKIRTDAAKRLILTIPANTNIAKLKNLFLQHHDPQGCPIELVVTQEKRSTTIKLGSAYRVLLRESLIESLKQAHPKNHQIQYY